MYDLKPYFTIRLKNWLPSPCVQWLHGWGYSPRLRIFVSYIKPIPNIPSVILLFRLHWNTHSDNLVELYEKTNENVDLYRIFNYTIMNVEGRVIIVSRTKVLDHISSGRRQPPCLWDYCNNLESLTIKTTNLGTVLNFTKGGFFTCNFGLAVGWKFTL